MLSPRWRKIMRDLQGNPARTLLVVLSIAVGVFAVGVLVATQMILSTDLSASYRRTNPTHAVLSTRADDDTLISVRRVPGVAAAEGRANLSVLVEDKASNEWRDLSLQIIPDFEAMTVNRVLPVAGAIEPDDHALLLERTSLTELGVAIGDKVQIEMPDGDRHTVTVEGTTHDLNIPSAIFNFSLQGYITPQAQEWLIGERYYSEIHIVIDDPDPTEAEIRAVAEAVQAKIEKGGAQVNRIFVPTPGKHWADELIQPLLTILVVLGFLTLILSGFLVVNTISAILAQQVRQIGVMKTIGAQTGQLVQMYVAAVLVFGLLSLVISIPLGAWATYAFVNFVANLLNFFAIPFYMPPQALALQIGVGLLVPLLASIMPILNGARLTVLQALSSYGLGKGGFGKGLIDRVLERVRLPRPILLSLRNTFRRKGRLALTLSTLVLGGAIFIAVLSVYSSLMATLDEALAYWNYDLDVNLARAYRTEQIVETASAIPGVTVVETWSGGGTRRVRPDGTESGNIRLLAAPATTQMINPRLLEGRWLLPTDENAIVLNSMVLDDESDLQVGQSVRLNVGEHESDWRIVGIVQGVLTGPIAYVNYPYFARETRMVGRAGQVQLALAQHDAAYQREMATRVKSAFEAVGIDVVSTDTTESTRENVVLQFNILVTFLTIMAVLIAVVGALGLTGTMSINVLERSREVGVMRAIGATDSSVLNIFLTEGLLIGFISWALGGIVSIPISQILSHTVGIAFLDAPLTYTFSTMGAGLWLFLVLLLAALSSWWPSWRASRLTVRDVLAYE